VESLLGSEPTSSMRRVANRYLHGTLSQPSAWFSGNTVDLDWKVPSSNLGRAFLRVSFVVSISVLSDYRHCTLKYAAASFFEIPFYAPFMIRGRWGNSAQLVP